MRDLEKPGETPGGRGTETPSLREGESRGQKKQKKRRHQSRAAKIEARDTKMEMSGVSNAGRVRESLSSGDR